jgi:hypothetical protein
MASKITSPSSTNKTGITVQTQINAVNATPLSPPSTPIENTASILTPPKGPDGKTYIPQGNAWVPPSEKLPYTSDQINAATKNGTDTSDVLKRGLDAVLNKEPDLGVGPKTINPSSGVVGSATGSVPGSFTADSKLIGQQLWKYKVKLFNHSQDYDIPTNMIKVLCVEDDLLTWPLRGYILVDSRLEVFERSENTGSVYFLRSDGRDEIKIDIWPEIEQGTLPDRIWKIDMEAVIYDVQDVPHGDMTLKAKKLYFWDKKFQNLLEKNIQWSTATGKRYISSPCPAPVAHATDMERAMYTGEAIASLLYEAGYEKYIDQSKWNWGKSKILFTAKATWSIWECIQYILTQQISDDSKNDICLLQWDRGTKLWTLLPMWKLFESAGASTPGDLQIEHMFFEETVTEQTVSMSPEKAPLDLNVSFEKDIKADEFNKIRNYQFSQTSGLDNAMAFTTRPVYSHWHRKKQFDLDAKENEISFVKDKYFKANYVEYLLSPGKYPVMTMNQTKIKQKSIEPQFSPVSTLDGRNDRFVRSLDGRGKILYAGLFLNQNLTIRMTGSTHRIAGTFIGVDRINTSSDTIYDYQLCGQYLVSNVKHIFQQQKFVNDITMVKVHAYKPLPVNEGIE